ncbi:hypothetical protein ACFQZC_26010 [Streptacidiphilus monticola]
MTQRPPSTDRFAEEPAVAAARPTALHVLAEAHGVRPTADTPPDTLVAVLAAMDVDASTEESAAHALEQLRRRQQTRLLPRCLVQRHGHPLSVDVPNPAELWVELEGGGTRTVSVPFPGPSAAAARSRPTCPSATTPSASAWAPRRRRPRR